MDGQEDDHGQAQFVLASSVELKRDLTVPHNLPTPLTSFVGRTQEVTAIQALLENTRLLTLVGPAGTGKTRLALQVAHCLRTVFVDGIWLLELASLPDSDLLPHTLASVLKIHEEADLPFHTAFSTAFQDKKVLLLLDNCEHLIQACATMVEMLLQACPTLHILVTSREVLGIGAETLFQVSPLPVPDLAGSTTVEDVEQFEAVRLFLERARSLQPDFQLTPTTTPAVIQICCQLDGLPLALELAAARLRLLPVEQLASRLRSMDEARFSLLDLGSRTAPARHSTLSAAIDWSYQLLSPSEQLLLRRLTVFAGSWTLEAAEAVCALPPLRRHEIQHLLGELVNKSLIQMHPELSLTDPVQPHPALARQARYRFLETIRQYAHMKLREAGEEELLQRQHLAYFLAVALQAEKYLRASEQLLWLHHLEQEHDNLCAAMTVAAVLPASDEGIQLASALSWFWALRGRFQEGLIYLEAMLTRRGESQDLLQAHALYQAALLSLWLRDFRRLAAYSEESLTYFRRLNYPPGICRAQANLVEFARWQGNYQKALALGDECLAILAEHPDPWTHALLLIPLLTIYRMQENYTKAAQLAEMSLSLFRSCGDRWGTAVLLNIQSLIASHAGDMGRVRACTEESLTLFKVLGDAHGIMETLYTSAMSLLLQGEHEQAFAVLEESRDHAQQSGDARAGCQILLDQGFIEIQQEQYEHATSLFTACAMQSQAHGDLLRFGKAKYFLGKIAIRQHHFQKGWQILRECLDLFFQEGQQLLFAACLETMAMAEAIDTQSSLELQRRVRWLGAAQALRSTLQVPLPSGDQAQYASAVAQLQTRLGEDEYAKALAQGQSLSPEQVLEEIRSNTTLEQAASPTSPSPLIDRLTARECEVLRLVSTGLSNKQIATTLGISPGTVKTHLLAIYGKLGVKSRTAAVYAARDRHLL